ncbi:hypothetical protein E8P82_11690 [Arthrobacter echini]|uniref:Uncharacterized protein n=1 Tax=Arthrobacter echini TaxID=1529066 RepID=A0A4S5E2M6_9MICC|nr:hypothetical protein [Arthrobacter echini]THJ65627.1 hypothetical protein E8P82_11690 [Arthrobacter echini]
MAAPRKSAQQLAARERAREQAKEITDRHERLIDLAAGFFEHEERAEQIRAEARERADAILAKAEQDAEAAATGAGAKVQAMLDTGESRAAVAARLGLSPAEMRRALEGAVVSTSSADSGDAETASPLAGTADEIAEEVSAETKAA